MLLYVRSKREEGKRDIVIPLWFPTVLLVNHLTVTVAWAFFRDKMKAEGVPPPTLGTAYRILHALWRCKLRFPCMPLVEVRAADGTRVRFRI